MSKSIKFKNNVYLDSSNIVYKRKSLKSILEQPSITLQFNTNFIYTTDLEYDCYKLGKMVFVNFHTIAFKAVPTATDWVISNLPHPSNIIISYLIGCRDCQGTTWRYKVETDGCILPHYTSAPVVGSTQNKQYYGVLIYQAKE